MLRVDRPEVADAAARSEKTLRILGNCMFDGRSGVWIENG